MTLVELLHAVHRRLTEAGFDHAFGGALALAYYGQPRATADVDINVFVPFDRAPEVVEALAPLGLEPDLPADRWTPVSGIRLRTPDGGAPLDVFCSIDHEYLEVGQRAELKPFGHDAVPIPFLSAEDIALFKMSFGRDRDWIDLRDIARTTTDLDLDYIERTLVNLRGPTMYPRMARFRALVRGSDA